MTKWLLFLDLNGWELRGFSTSKLRAIDRLIYLKIELWWPRGVTTSIWMEGNQEASLPKKMGRLRGFSILILNRDDQGASLPQFKWKVNKGILFLRNWCDGEAFNLNHELWWPRGLSASKPGAIESLLYPNLELWQLRGISTSIWMEGNQGASLPLNLGWLRGFSISMLNCDEQGASFSCSEWKVTEGLLYLRTWGDWETYLSQSWIVMKTGLLYLDLNGR